MTLTNLRSLAGSFGVCLVSVGVAVYGFVSESSLLALLATSLLATVAILGARATIVCWPLGLMANLLLAYAMYLWSWVTNTDGISSNEATTYFLLATAFFGGTALVRSRRSLIHGASAPAAKLENVATSVLLVAVPTFLVVLVLMRTGTSPERLISGHLSGGDHGPHNELTHRLIDPSGGSELTSPFSVYSYPRAVHYLIGLMNVFDGTVGRLPTIASEYLSAAQFEYLQLAAMLQSSLAVIVGRMRSVQRTICAVASVIFVMSIDSYVAHAFWSGFTTSLTVTWILLLMIALCRLDMVPDRVLSRCVLWVALAVTCWITYQPFAVVGLVMLLGEIGRAFAERLTVRRISSLFGPTVLGIAMPLIVPIAVVFLPWIVEGRTSPAVTSLLLDGSLYRPHIWTVLLLLAAGVGGTLVFRSPWVPQQLQVFLGVAGLAIGWMFVVMAAGGPGPMDQPYYVQKIFWVLVFLGVPLVLAHVLDWSLWFAGVRGWSTGSTVTAIVAAAILSPVATGRTPAAATRHASVDWFARAVVRNLSADITRSVAFYPADRLGSHLANLALKAQSSTQFPIGMSLAGNAHLGCRFVNREPVEVVFTGAHGLSLLAEAGCRLDRKYVVDGQLVDVPPTPYTDIVLDTEYRVGNADIGQFLLFRGVKGVKQWGAELTGYLSAIGIQVPAGARDVSVELSYRPSDTGPSEPAVTFGIGGRPVVTAPLHGFHWRTVRVPLVGVKPGEKLEVTVDCAWSDEEAGTLVEGRKPDACLDLRTVRVVSGPVVDQQDQDPPTRVTPSS